MAELSPGVTLSHYRIISKIGAGGMGEVYRAQDTKIAGHEGTKMAGGGSDAFFNSLTLFKNIESRWDVSGFTKKPDEQQLADE